VGKLKAGLQWEKYDRHSSKGKCVNKKAKGRNTYKKKMHKKKRIVAEERKVSIAGRRGPPHR
jgi:hypothetical protein